MSTEQLDEAVDLQASGGASRKPSFGRELFRGSARIDLLTLPPGVGQRLDEESEAFLQRLREFLTRVDAPAIERDDRLPDEVITGLRDLGAFAIKIPRAYGGLGLPGVCYHRALMLASSVHPALSELLAAHQAIGLPQPITLFGTEEQKREFLPRCVREISAFALTEPDIGNDPYRIHTTAVPHSDTYVLNGVKSWATNGVLADLLVVLAQVPGMEDHAGGMTAFVVEADSPGVTVEHRNAFLGLRGVENGVIRLHEVVVPAGNRIGGEGEGLEIALAAQDTGRLSLPAVCAAAAKWSLKIAREWSKARVQWGRSIGEHEAVAGKIAFIAATAFALEAIVEVTGRHADDEQVDTRIDAELAKLYATEKAWLVADELVQIRGGRGYETAESAAARGERGVPVEQLLRDLRVGRIFDGSSEVLRVFLAHEILSEYRWDGPGDSTSTGLAHYGPLVPHLLFVEQAAHKVAQRLTDGLARWGEEFEEHQLHVGRLVDIVAELYAMSTACVYAKARDDLGEAAVELADAFCRQATRRVEELFDRLASNTDDHDRVIARRVLDEQHTWLEQGVLDPSAPGPWIAQSAPGPSRHRNLRRKVPKAADPT
ncbi:acyl-CoA dehydrogenase family protein [Saccharothrix texasensis]|uniref:Alkylation response protein AidB-like acyl-CoA dehydrogenase n=1 Tax=Saccharothrix texasensis TaxID=103734 RepID=A0A3N1H420_9PSEU|nr:acyl-CoA dehydrogenase family protein [Saccharothrix texasensis]ROP37269.1 hypothetical protein EDD40_2571 [Saccharothrix texasensis]